MDEYMNLEFGAEAKSEMDATATLNQKLRLCFGVPFRPVL